MPQGRDLRQTELIIVGASVRAAAESAVKAGLSVFAFDLFADRDLRAIAHCVRVPDGQYPRALVGRLKRLPADIPWMYTGGIENHVAWIREITLQRPLRGVSWDVAQRTHDLDLRQAIATAAGWDAPRRLQPGDSQPSIMRPRTHCGGFGIQYGHMHSSNSVAHEDLHTREEFIAGPSYSGTFLGHGPTTQLLGITRQHVASDIEDHPLRALYPFAYAGSVGPLPLNAEAQDAWLRLGRAIRASLPMQGLFGVDAIFSASRQRWNLIEINPRYTASMELIERATGTSVLAAHLSPWAACPTDVAHDRALCAGVRVPATPSCHAKRILYAPWEIHVTASVVKRMDRLRWGPGMVGPVLSDLPCAGDVIRRHRPLATVFAHGTDESTATQCLTATARQVMHEIAATGAMRTE